MTDFRSPGMSDGASVYRSRGGVFLVVAVVIALLATLIYRLVPDDRFDITMRTAMVAGGVVDGSTVVINGAEAGTVREVIADGPDSFRVVLDLTPSLVDKPGLLTSSMTVTYAPKNLFGISAVVLTTDPRGQRLGDGDEFTVAAPEDATLTTLLRNLNDLNVDAFGPHMSSILEYTSQATMGLLPVIGVMSNLAKDIADTQRVTPRETLPQYARMIAQLQQTAGDVLPPIQSLLEWEGPRRPGYLEKLHAGMSFGATTLMDDVQTLLGPRGLATLVPVVPTALALLGRVQASFPDAQRNGLQIATLLERIRRALPDGPNGPVYTVDVVLRAVPSVAAALGTRGAPR